MSFGGSSATPTSSPTVANVQASDASSNEKGVPLQWWIGPGKCALYWIVPEAYDFEAVPITQTSGSGKAKTTSTTGHKCYGSVAGLGGLGLGRRVRAIVRNDETVWTGSVVRDDNPASPDYWRAHITTSIGEVYVYWGRPNQPLDDILLAGLAAKGIKHPAYRGQILVVFKKYYFGDNVTNVPNTVLYIDREPQPLVGAFAPQDNIQGESIVAGMLELATHPIFGAGIAASRFVAEESQSLSQSVIADLGCHAPYLDRAKPIRDVFADHMLYYDGWARIQEGKIRLGRHPHNGTVPAGLTELTVHDFTQRPKITAGSPSSVQNAVDVTCRDVTDDFEKKVESGVSSENAKARKVIVPATVEMLGFITREQALKWAKEASSTAAEGEYSGTCRPRSVRAVWSSGAALNAGDNFRIDLHVPKVDQVMRITRRTDYYTGEVELEVKSEPGVYPTPYVPPSDIRPPSGAAAVPEEIKDYRLFELTPDLAGTPIGLPITFLAKRPKSFTEETGLLSQATVGYNALHSATGASYDVLGYSMFWAVRGTLRAPLAASSDATTVQITLDADNLDIGRLESQSAQAQGDDTLLLIMGDEVASVGQISISGLAWDLPGTLRARRGSLPAAHATTSECWLVYRRELRVFTHAAFVENTTRFFKLQPYASTGATREQADCDPIEYTFRDRAAERPVIVIDAVAAAMKAGSTYVVSGQISDVNGDLKDYQISAALVTGGVVSSTITLKSGTFAESERALMGWRVSVVWPVAGVWRIVVWASDDTGAFTQAASADFTVLPADYTLPGLANLVDQVQQDFDQKIDDVQSNAQTLLAQIEANGAAITSESSTRQTADQSLTTSLNALQSEYNSNKSAVATQISAITTVNEAQATTLSLHATSIGNNASLIASETTARTTADSAHTSAINSLNATVGSLNSTVATLSSAYIVGGQAVSTWGFKLDANGKVVRMQAIAASGGSQADVGVISFSGADLQSDTFVAGSYGWRLRPDGTIQVNDGYFAGVLHSPRIEFGCTILTEPGSVEGGEIMLEHADGINKWHMDVFSNRNLRLFSDTTSGAQVWIEGSLRINGYGYGDFTSYSSRLMKDNIRPMGNVLDKVAQLAPSRFEWNGYAPDFERVGKTDIGLIAEDTQAIFPEVVVTDQEGRLAINYPKLVPIVIQAIQELKAQVSALSSS